MTRPAGRWHSAAFYGLCPSGITASAVLAGAGAGDEPDLVVRVVSQDRSELRTRVVAEVRNTSDRPLCTQVRVAARDREARDLAAVDAAPALQRVEVGASARGVGGA